MVPAEHLYSHAQAIAILRMSPDRLRNFVRVPVYGAVLGPAQQIGGRGKGTRMLYGWYALCKLAVADALLSVGWTPAEIVRAIAVLRPADFRLPRDYESEGEASPNAQVLVRHHGRWTVCRAGDVAATDWSGDIVYIHGLLSTTVDVAKQIEALEADGAMPVKRQRHRGRKLVDSERRQRQ